MPNFDKTKVDPDRLKLAADNIAQAITQLNRAFTALTFMMGNASRTGNFIGVPNGMGLSLTGVVGLNSWKGPAKDQFMAQYQQDSEFFNAHMKVLETLNNQLREAAGIFDGADTRALDLVNKLKIG